MCEKKNRFLEMARCYHEMAPLTVPQYEWMQLSAIETLADLRNEQTHLIDLGGGSGRFAGRFLERFPNANATVVDSSPTFLAIAEEHLRKFRGRIQLVESKLEDNWENKRASPVTAIASMSCIHHLTTEEKQTVYQQAISTLTSGGVFINVDEMKAKDEVTYLQDLTYWWRYVETVRHQIRPEQKEWFEAFYEHFRKWKIRNIDQLDQPKKKGEDLHDTVEFQLSMLSQAGAIRVHSPFHFRLWTAIAAQAPDKNHC